MKIYSKRGCEVIETDDGNNDPDDYDPSGYDPEDDQE